MELPDALAEALKVVSGDEIEVAKGRAGLFDLWKTELPFDPVALIERMNAIGRDTLDPL